MNINNIRIDGIPAVLWGDPCGRMIIAAHGRHSSKTDDCIRVLAEQATAKGYRVLSFDLPKHGERANESGLLMPDECVRELKTMYSFAVNRDDKVSVFGCSIGAYFELLAFADMEIECAWFLSPVTDMERLIRNIMEYCHISEKEFQEKVKVNNDIEPLYFPYYSYVKSHPITSWKHKTYILRGEKDTICDYGCVKDFADGFNCELTEQKGGEHWFHTQEQLRFLDRWALRCVADN